MSARKVSFAAACAQYVNRFTCEHVPSWATQPLSQGPGIQTTYYAPQFRSDREWYDATKFPGEPGWIGVADDAYTTGQTWPLGESLDRPFVRRRLGCTTCEPSRVAGLMRCRDCGGTVNGNPPRALPTPGPWEWKEDGEANVYHVIDSSGRWLLALLHNGEPLLETQRANMRQIAETPVMVMLLRACEAYIADHCHDEQAQAIEFQIAQLRRRLGLGPAALVKP